MNNKTFLELSKEQTNPFKELYYEILDRFNSHDYDMAVSSMSERLKDIITRCKIQLECEAELLKGANEYIKSENDKEKIAEKLKQSFWSPEHGFFELPKNNAESEIKEINARIKVAARQNAPTSQISNGAHTFAELYECLDAFILAMIKQMAVLEHRPIYGRHDHVFWIRATLPTIAKAHLSVCFLIGPKHEKALKRFCIFSDEEIAAPDLNENIVKLITCFYVVNDLL